MADIFYIAGLMFSLGALALLALTLTIVLAPAYGRRLEHLLPPLIWGFLAAATLVALAYLWELLAAVTSTNAFEREMFWHFRTAGSQAWLYWLNFTLAFVPQLLWLPRFRRPLAALFIVVVSLVPLLMERIIVIVG